MNTVLVLVAVWVVSGALTTYLMARSGHRHPAWLLIGLVLGPLGLPVLYERVERRSRLVSAHDQAADAGSGLHVLVALDGSKEADAAYDAALRILGARMHTVHLVEVLDFDASDDVVQATTAEQRLARCAEQCPASVVSYDVLGGRPAPALVEFAERRDVDVIVAGRRGRGLTTLLLGSVSSALLRTSSVPVLVGGYQTDHPRATDPELIDAERDST